MREQTGLPRPAPSVPTSWQAVAMAAPGRPRRDDATFVTQAVTQWSDGPEDVGYLGRVFAQTSLPYRNPGDDLPVWQRFNGSMTLSVQPGPPLRQPDGTFKPSGYPYGVMPRLLLTWLGTEAVRRQERVIPLGESLSDFCRQLDLAVNGGANGAITRLRDQTRRLLRARLSVDHSAEMGDYRQESAQFLQVANRYDLWWSDTTGAQTALLPSFIELSEDFYTEMVERPVPVDLGALRLLSGAPLRLDIYVWLTYRMSYLRSPTIVTWSQLRSQFGTQATTRQAQRKFQLDFLNHLGRVLAVYPEARVEEHAHGLRLLPGAPSVARNGRRALNAPAAGRTSSRRDKPLEAGRLLGLDTSPQYD